MTDKPKKPGATKHAWNAPLSEAEREEIMMGEFETACGVATASAKVSGEKHYDGRTEEERINDMVNMVGGA